MKFLISTIALLIFSGIASADQVPNKVDIIRELNLFYQGNTRFESCMHTLNYPPKPLSVDALYELTLTVAAYAEGILTECK
jgi:hypothetical protein